MDAGKLALRGVAGLALAISAALTGPMAVPIHPAPRVVATPASAVEPGPAMPDRNAVPDGGRAVESHGPGEAVSVWDLPAGTLVLNPVSGRHEVLDPAVARTAVLMGDSQAAGAAGISGAHTWVAAGLGSRGYKVDFVGAGGTGFVTASVIHANYPDAVESGAVTLPYGNPALVVVQGGGNDAAKGATDAQILANAERLLRDLKASYPRSDFLIIGTLSSGAGGRRAEVDALLAGFAQGNGLAFISAGDWISRYGLADKMADGVHLNASGHQVLTGVLAEKLSELNLEAPGR